MEDLMRSYEPTVCNHCGGPAERDSKGRQRSTCSVACMKARRGALSAARGEARIAAEPDVFCKVCGVLCPKRTPHRAQRLTCSTACRNADNATRMASTNRRYASDRMKANNPMHRGDNLERMRATLKAIGHRPPVHGGNGTGLTVPQARLLAALGEGWVPEYPVRTHAKRGTFPGVLKPDIAHLEMKIAIEVDGLSHSVLKVKAADAAKDAFLTGHGWTVLRFKNREVMADLEGCVQTVLSTTSKLKGSTPTPLTAS